MDYFFAIDWEALFRPKMSVLETVIRVRWSISRSASSFGSS